MIHASAESAPKPRDQAWAAALLDDHGRVTGHAGDWSGLVAPVVGQAWTDWLAQQMRAEHSHHIALSISLGPATPYGAIANESMPRGGDPAAPEQEEKSPVGQHFESATSASTRNTRRQWAIVRRTATEADSLRDALDEMEQLQQQMQGLAQRYQLLEEELHGLTYAVSHDLLAPLRLIAGFADLLAETSGSDNEESSEWIEAIQQASHRAQAMTSDLLALARAGSTPVQLSAVDLSALAHSVCLDLERAHPEHPLVWQIEPNLIVNSDAGLLRIILENLLGNAWKFTRGRPNPALVIERRPSHNPASSCVAIIDNGVGFDPTASERLFSPFQRLHPEEQFPGIGLGLAGARRLMRRCQGDICATAQVDKGAEFTLLFAPSAVWHAR